MSDLMYRSPEYGGTDMGGAIPAHELPHVRIGAESAETPADQPSYADVDASGLGVGYEDDGPADEAPEPATDAGGNVPPDDTGNTPPPGGSGEYDGPEEPEPPEASAADGPVAAYSGAIGMSDESPLGELDGRSVVEKVKDLARERAAATLGLPSDEIDLADPDVRRAFLGDELADAYEELGLGAQADERPIETVTTSIFGPDAPADGEASQAQSHEPATEPAADTPLSTDPKPEPRTPIEQRTDDEIQHLWRQE
jgi:hypothetical protein